MYVPSFKNRVSAGTGNRGQRQRPDAVLPAGKPVFTLPAAFAVFLLLLSPARAAFDKEVWSGRYAAASGAGASNGHFRLSPFHTPAALAPGSWGLAAGRHCPYQLDEVCQAETGMFYDGSRWGLSINGAQLTAADQYIEHIVNFQAAVRFFDVLTAGASAGFKRLEIRSFSYAFFPDDAFGITLQIGKSLTAGIFARDLASAGFSKRIFTPVWQAGFSVDTPSGLSLDFEARRDQHEFWQFTFSQGLRIRNAIEIITAVSDRPLRFSLGAAVYFGGFGFSGAFRSHPALGATRYMGMDWHSGNTRAIIDPAEN